MSKSQKSYFFPENEYTRYVIGRFSNEDFVPHMLEEYSHLASDSPQISEYYKQGEWTIIPCPIEKINRGCFLDLMGWLTQENEEAFAIALHPVKSYFSRRDALNRYGDTAFVGFDDGTMVSWYFPRGLIDDNAYSKVKQEMLEFTNMPSPCNCKEFLEFIDARELISHFKL
ncbi:MAG: hypothetical protein HFH68_04490 [Lachnospiraceae bacterium]|nr:hypothetical protein [Lachnospiraceae bacterium]